MTGVSEEQSALLTFLQRGIPFEENPFAGISSQLKISEEKVVSEIAQLIEAGIIRDISGIFDGQKLGYYLSLVSFKVSEVDVEKAAEVISAHPGVSHNYLRNHEYNIWFTLAEENEELFNQSLSALAEKAGARDVLVLRNEKLYKIGVILPVGKSAEKGAGAGPVAQSGEESPITPLSVKEKSVVSLLQKPMPLTVTPFMSLLQGTENKIDWADFLSLAEDFRANGLLRRYAAVLRHRKAGYSANAMTAWKMPASGDEAAIIEPFAKESTVTHLYKRTIFPGRWEHPLFAMIHAHSTEELELTIKGLSEKSGLTDYMVLESLQEFKKKRVTYFSDAFENWRKENI